MTERELFLEYVDNTISTYDDAPSEVKNGYINIPIGMLKKLRAMIDSNVSEMSDIAKETFGLD